MAINKIRRRSPSPSYRAFQRIHLGQWPKHGNVTMEKIVIRPQIYSFNIDSGQQIVPSIVRPLS